MTAAVVALLYLVCFAAGFLAGVLVERYRQRRAGRHRAHRRALRLRG